MPGFLLSLAVALSMSVQARESLMAQEPTRPDLFSQNFEVRCGADRLRLTGYGAHYPGRSARPAIVVNGRALRGGEAERLRTDLSRQGAAYRMTAGCRPEGRGIAFGFHVGERVFPGERPPGEMRYYIGSATIDNGRIERYSGLEPIGEEQFWFR